MKTKRITEWDLLRAFDSLGIHFHSTGTLDAERDGKTVKLYDYYRTDNLTAERKEELSKIFPSIQFFCASPEFAPEWQYSMIANPKAAKIREMNDNTNK